MLNHMFLVVVDAHTKWIEVVPMSNSTSFSTIQQLRTLFAQFGIPQTVVTDKGPCFISEEFREFMTRNGIHHIRSSPYHPASNGLAERAVRVFKEGFKKMKVQSPTRSLVFYFHIETFRTAPRVCHQQN